MKNNSPIINMLRLLRWPNLLIVAITQYAAAYFLIHDMQLPVLLGDWRMLVVSMSTVLIAAGGYVINDYYDVKIDYINKPERVVVGRFLKRRTTLILHAVLNGLGTLGGFVVAWQLGVINVLAAGLLWLYSNQLKRLPLLGNIIVALLTGAAVFVLFVLYRQALFLFAIYAAFAFFISLMREIVKDMEDMEGDKEFGCQTLPIVIGLRRAKVVVYLISLIFLLVVAALMQHEARFWWVFSGLLVMLSWHAYKLYRADKSSDFGRLSTLNKQIMILGLISMLFMK